MRRIRARPGAQQPLGVLRHKSVFNLRDGSRDGKLVPVGPVSRGTIPMQSIVIEIGGRPNGASSWAVLEQHRGGSAFIHHHYADLYGRLVARSHQSGPPKDRFGIPSQPLILGMTHALIDKGKNSLFYMPACGHMPGLIEIGGVVAIIQRIGRVRRDIAQHLVAIAQGAIDESVGGYLSVHLLQEYLKA